MRLKHDSHFAGKEDLVPSTHSHIVFIFFLILVYKETSLNTFFYKNYLPRKAVTYMKASLSNVDSQGRRGGRDQVLT